MRTYYGSEMTDTEIKKPECFEITGEMADGTKVYEKVENRDGKQYLRYTKYGMQVFIAI